MSIHFPNDLAKAQKTEKAIADFLGTLLPIHGEPVDITSYGPSRPFWDVGFMTIKYGIFTVEIKSDNRYGRRGSDRVFIETGKPNGEKSGLSITEAHRFIIHLPSAGLLLSAPPKPLLAFIENACKSCHYMTKAGDGNSNGYLIPYKVLAGLPFVKTLPFAS